MEGQSPSPPIAMGEIFQISTSSGGEAQPSRGTVEPWGTLARGSPSSARLCNFQTYLSFSIGKPPYIKYFHSFKRKDYPAKSARFSQPYKDSDLGIIRTLTVSYDSFCVLPEERIAEIYSLPVSGFVFNSYSIYLAGDGGVFPVSSEKYASAGERYPTRSRMESPERRSLSV